MSMTVKAGRGSAAILPQIANRWSPRAFDGTPVPEADLLTMIEAAGLAPSSFNSQPWAFVYAARGDAHWERLLGVLVPFNQSWAKEAGGLIFVASKESGGPENKPLYSHSFDAGAAWAMLALQADHMGWRVHGMLGVDFARVADELGLPQGYRFEAAIAVGRQASPEALPEEMREREIPNGRRSVSEIAFAGRFGG